MLHAELWQPVALPHCAVPQLCCQTSLLASLGWAVMALLFVKILENACIPQHEFLSKPIQAMKIAIYILSKWNSDRKAWKFLQLLPGNSETTARPDLDLCDLCSQLSYIHIFHVFSERQMIWENVSALAHPLFPPWKERSCKGPRLPYEFFSPRAEPGERQLPCGHQLNAVSCLHPHVGERHLGTREHGRKTRRAFSGLLFCSIIGAETPDYMDSISAQHSSDHG